MDTCSKMHRKHMWIHVTYSHTYRCLHDMCFSPDDYTYWFRTPRPPAGPDVQACREDLCVLVHGIEGTWDRLGGGPRR